MMLRVTKLSLVFGVALFYAFVVFSNLTDYDSNYQFVRHVLMMDSTFPGNHGIWRAINSPKVHTAFYLSIIAWEIATMVLCGWGALRLAKSLTSDAKNVSQGQRFGDCGPDAWIDDVACCLPGRGRGMVPDVAIENLEWPGDGLSDVRSSWNRTACFSAAGSGGVVLAFRQGGFLIAHPQEEPQHSRREIR